MKLTSIASALALAAVAQAAPAAHVATSQAESEPLTITIYGKHDKLNFDSSFLSYLSEHFHLPNWSHHASSSISSEPTAPLESSSPTNSALSSEASSDPQESASESESISEETDEETSIEDPASETETETPSGSGSASSDWIVQMVCAVNKVRAAHGASPLGISDELNQIAQKHSEYQDSIKQMTHDDPAGGVGARLTAMGVQWMSAAENVAAGMSTPEEAQKAWEASPGHLANMVDTSMTFVGVGRSSNYYTQEFFGNGSGTRPSNIPQCN
ncbi:hypothetical protein LPJ78_003408 [Coemansia sp. RSA 989]|nr:hypothetical protein LPJ68_002493 [Coemansia sp. RSA 1086]KAJ1749871.1 hypothetical protein LPJ79_003366 [Coemansia sp. RSA 1821]KAJ1864393.1 hypothetical protein LPJ78_003408 [Coemansia sp. RSA 989]KAJ2675403.1 hypothetical protein IWW42_001189 [Coemansia sp. RSA 1085]